jgi:hypothetical protein
VLVLAAGFDMPAAVGTSLLVIAINSATAFAARMGSHVSLDWPLLGVFTVAALAGALAGSRVASRVDASRLTAAFTICSSPWLPTRSSAACRGCFDRERPVLEQDETGAAGHGLPVCRWSGTVSASAS